MVQRLFSGADASPCSAAVPAGVGTIDSKWIKTASHDEAQNMISLLCATMVCGLSDDRKSANAVGEAAVGLVGVHARTISQHECLLRGLVLVHRVMVDGTLDQYGDPGSTPLFVGEMKPHARAAARARQLLMDHHMSSTVEVTPPPGIAELE